MEVFVGSNKLHTPKPEQTREKLKIQFDFLEITKEDPSLKFSLSLLQRTVIINLAKIQRELL